MTLYDALWSAGAAFGLRDAGYYTIDALRIEAGRRAWGAELSPDETPWEAGLGYAVKLDKPAPFIGRDALRAQQAAGAAQAARAVHVRRSRRVSLGRRADPDGRPQRRRAHVRRLQPQATAARSRWATPRADVAADRRRDRSPRATRSTSPASASRSPRSCPAPERWNRRTDRPVEALSSRPRSSPCAAASTFCPPPSVRLMWRVRHLAIAALAAVLLGAAVALATDAPERGGALQSRASRTTRRQGSATTIRQRRPRRASGSWQWERWTHGRAAGAAGRLARSRCERPTSTFLRANRSETTVTWIGHATALLQVGRRQHPRRPASRATGRRRCRSSGRSAWVPPAIALDDLPHVDVVLHLAQPLRSSRRRQRERGLRRSRAGRRASTCRWASTPGSSARDLPVHATMDWWDRRRRRRPRRALRAGAALERAQSWWDRNETLWGGFVVEAPGFRFISTGDTGYSQRLRRHRRSASAASTSRAIPIGGYAPRWFMAPQHVDPDEAVADPPRPRRPSLARACTGARSC